MHDGLGRKHGSGSDSMTGPFRLGVIAALALALPTGAYAEPLACNGGQKPMQAAELIFGRNIGAVMAVSEAAWRRFVARELTPRFPRGLTITDAAGQWRDARRHMIVREPSKVVQIILPGGSDDLARLDAVVAAYKLRFHQQSVAVVTWPVCVQF